MFCNYLKEHRKVNEVHVFNDLWDFCYIDLGVAYCLNRFKQFVIMVKKAQVPEPECANRQLSFYWSVVSVPNLWLEFSVLTHTHDFAEAH